MLYYIYYQEDYGDHNSKSIWLMNVDFDEAIKLLTNDDCSYSTKIEYGIPSFITPIMITNDPRLSLVYRKAFDLNEFKLYCGLNIKDIEIKPFYYTRESLDPRCGLIILEGINKINSGAYNFLSFKFKNFFSFISQYEDLNAITFEDYCNNFIVFATNDSDKLSYTEEEIFYDNLWNNLPILWKNLLIKKYGEGLFYNYNSSIHILKQMFEIENLEITTEYDLSHLKYFTHLKSLKVNPISNFNSDVKYKTINTNDFKFLKKLEHIDIQGTTINSLSFINDLKNLKHINLSNVNLIDNNNLFIENNNLEYLNISRVNFKNYDFIKYLINLKVLIIYKSTFDNFELLLNLLELRELDISFTSFSNLEYLKNCSNLTKLIASHTKIKDIKEVSVLKKLNYLDLSDNHIVYYIENLYNLNFLESLFLNNCNLKTIPLLKNIKNLEIKNNDDIDVDIIENYKKIIGYKIENFVII